MEEIVSKDEIYEITVAAREQVFEALVKSINEEISKAANSGKVRVLWDAKKHQDILWDRGMADRLIPLLQEAGYSATFSFDGLFSYYAGCMIEWAEKEPETKEEEPEKPIVEEPKKRKWGRKNKCVHLTVI